MIVDFIELRSLVCGGISSIDRLPKFTQLKELSVRTRIDGEAKYIVQLEKLESLKVWSIAKQDYELIKKQLPNCDIAFVTEQTPVGYPAAAASLLESRHFANRWIFKRSQD